MQNQIDLWKQYKSFVAQGWKADLADKERLITPFLFAITLLLLFNFVFDEISQGIEKYIFTAEVFLTSLFALQMSFVRIFTPDQQDKVFVQLQSYPLNYYAWFLGKYTLALLYSLSVFVPVVLLCGLFFSGSDFTVWNAGLWLTAGLSLIGLSTLGILLSTLTLKASGREMLFPLLYFPLAVPVLIASVQSSLIFLSTTQAGAWQWLGLLTGFDIIYFTLGLLLYGELINSV
mgnify:CR=1 FL=1